MSIFGIVFVLGQISAALAAVPPPDGSSPVDVPIFSASVLAPPDSQGKGPSSSSEDDGLDVPLQSLVADPSGPLLADAAANSTSAGVVVASSRTVVVTFAEDVTFEASSSHVGETVPSSWREEPYARVSCRR